MNHIGAMGWTDIQDVGDVFTEGAAIVRVESGPVEILKVRPQLNTDGVEYLGAVISGPDRDIGAVTDPGWPVKDSRLGEVIPAEGAHLEGKSEKTHSYVFILGFRVLEDGRHTSDGVEIEYRYRSRRYRLHVPITFAVCTDVPPDACEANTREL